MKWWLMARERPEPWLPIDSSSTTMSCPGSASFGSVEVTSTIVRVKGDGLLRKPANSRTGERLLQLPASAIAVLRRRPSMTQDVYLGRRIAETRAAEALDNASGDVAQRVISDDFSMTYDEGQTQ